MTAEPRYYGGGAPFGPRSPAVIRGLEIVRERLEQGAKRYGLFAAVAREVGISACQLNEAWKKYKLETREETSPADKTTAEREAYDAGRRARGNGTQYWHNPHLDWPLAVAWAAGWHHIEPDDLISGAGSMVHQTLDIAESIW